MTNLASVAFAKPGRKPAGALVIMIGEGMILGPQARGLGIEDLISRAAVAADFKGKSRSTLELLAPAGLNADRILAIGTGESSDISPGDWLAFGGVAAGKLGKAGSATVLLERPDGRRLPRTAAADFALGADMRAYRFDKYKQKKDDDDGAAPLALTVVVGDAAGARAAWKARAAVADGVTTARDLVNEPANVLDPIAFAERTRALKKLGVAVEVLGEAEMRKLGMRALLGVAQGSERPPRLVAMRWNGGRGNEAPIAFVGKGVVFDTGGISIKPAGGMEDMKGDMGGAAAVTGLMQALATRKARANVVGVIGLVENMPDGKAQRPGDIVTAMTGTTIEIVNTDAEGRLVLADALAYTEDKFKPRIIVDLATLTGAIIVALGHHHAGLFASDDRLAEALFKAGQATGERVWRLPLAKEYDKLIDSKFADVKNAGSREAGSITGAQFLKRFVKDTPWAHLDVAGTAFGSPQTDTNKSWASGWGVRLLDRLVADNYER